MAEKKPLSTEPYKGTRDFYPEDMFILNFVLDGMRKAAERFGYVEYSSSPLESTELYKAKSGEEMVNEQTYSFTDRGGREVTLRPEMTPTVARMVAHKRRELPFPLRWYSIPNLFRYEQPQRGRLREHYQLNVDLFGATGAEADVEIMSVASEVMKGFGATEKDFLILINHRGLMNALAKEIGLNEEKSRALFTLIDRRAKIEKTEFKNKLSEIVGTKAELVETLLDSADLAEFLASAPANLATHPSVAEIEQVLLGLATSGTKNIRFSPSLMRGFDYYTGIVFELYDTDPKNRRSLFGGGRYDDLVTIFGKEPVPAVGFGMGDVTLQDFLDVHGLLPAYKPATDLYICRADKASADGVAKLATNLRHQGVNVSVDLTSRKLGDQIASADKQRIPYVLCVGERELQSGKFSVKELSTGKETSLEESELASFFKH